MKKFLLGTVALAALGASANAADMRARPYVAAVVPYTTWTGCHVGGAVGTEWGRDPGYTSTSQSGITFAPGVVVFPGQQIANGFDMNGFNGGFYAGCDYQAGAWVFGFEGDWSTVNKDGQALANPFNTNIGPLAFTVPVAYSAKERWFSTARGRLGYAVDKWLFFVSGGAAWAKIDSDAFATITPFGAPFHISQSDTRTGWTVGAGAEYALSYGWSIRSEYLYIRIPNYTTFTPGQPGNPGSTFPTFLSTRLENHVLRSGLTYKFGYDPGVVAAVTK